MNFQDYIRYDAVGLAELIRKKEVSADEVLQAALNRLDEVNPKLNLLAHDLRERAAAWQGSSENADTPLAGVPSQRLAGGLGRRADMVGFTYDAALHCQTKQRFDPSLS